MPVPDLKWWKSKTSGTVSERNNPLILDIDILLQEYHKATKTDVQKQKILILILYYCTEWLMTKGTKAKSWRRPYVWQLSTAVEAELRTPAMLQATQDRIGGKPGKKMEEDPIEVLQPRDARQKFGLQADVSWGRRSASNAGYFVDNFGKRKNLTGHLSDLQGQTIDDYVGQLQIIATSHGGEKTLQYLSKRERLAVQLSKWPDNLFHLGGQDQAYQTQTGVDAHNVRILDLYAMDSMEFLYVRKPLGAGRFHHSSFLAGKAVLCAGEIAVDQGRITKISNSSGHYRPQTRELLNCVMVLRDKYGIDPSTLAVTDMATETDWNTAQEFLNLMGRPPIQPAPIQRAPFQPAAIQQRPRPHFQIGRK